MLDEMRMRTACFARAPQRCTSYLIKHFLLTFQEVIPLSKTRNQLKLKALAAIHPTRARFCCPLVPTPLERLPALCLGFFGGHQDHRVPRAPLPGVGVTHRQGDLSRHLRGRYSSVIAPTGSCARPRSSPRLGGPSVVGSLQVVASPCWTMALPDIISAISV